MYRKAIHSSHPRSASFAFRAEAGGKSLGRSQGDSLAPANSTPRALGSRAAPLSSCESPRRLGAGPPPRGSARDLLRPGWVGVDYYREMWVFPSGSVVKNPLAVQKT